MKNATKQWKLGMIGAVVALLGMIVLTTYLLTPANAQGSTDAHQTSAKEGSSCKLRDVYSLC